MSIAAPEAFIGSYARPSKLDIATRPQHFPHYMGGESLKSQMFQVPMGERVDSARQLIGSFTRVLGTEYYTPVSPKSFTQIAAEITVSGKGTGEGTRWSVTSAPIHDRNRNEAGRHLCIQREIPVDTGVTQITTLSVNLTEGPSQESAANILYESVLNERVADKTGQRSIHHDIFHPGPNTYAARDAANSFMDAFGAIADMSPDDVTIVNKCNTSEIVPQSKMTEAADKARAGMVTLVEGRQQLVAPNGEVVSRTALVDAALSEQTEETPECQRASHMTPDHAYRIITDAAINGDHSLLPPERKPRPKTAPITRYSDPAEATLAEEVGTDLLTDTYIGFVNDTVNIPGVDNAKKPAPTINGHIRIDENGKSKEMNVRIYDHTAVAGPFGYPVREPVFVMNGANEVHADAVSMIIRTEGERENRTFAVIHGKMYDAGKRTGGTDPITLTSVDSEIAYTVARRARMAAEVHRKNNPGQGEIELFAA